jgi:hypothetical protein
MRRIAVLPYCRIAVLLYLSLLQPGAGGLGHLRRGIRGEAFQRRLRALGIERDRAAHHRGEYIGGIRLKLDS